MKIFLAGHNGMAGSAIYKELLACGYNNIIVRNRSELDLLNQKQVLEFFSKELPETVIIAAAKVGGIQANIANPYTFLFDNLQIQNNIINSSYIFGVKNIIFLASSCIYSKNTEQPMKEENLFDGRLEPTNEGYALAKIAGIKLLEGLNSQHKLHSTTLIPCNLYGPNDSFDLNLSHVLSALVKRFVDAKKDGVNEIKLWGTGNARREFMHVTDLAKSVVFFLENPILNNYINVGTGFDISIKDLAELISSKVDYKGSILWDNTMPDGMKKKCMDVSKMNQHGFQPTIRLEDGIIEMINIYNNLKNKV